MPDGIMPNPVSFANRYRSHAGDILEYMEGLASEADSDAATVTVGTSTQVSVADLEAAIEALQRLQQGRLAYRPSEAARTTIFNCGIYLARHARDASAQQQSRNRFLGLARGLESYFLPEGNVYRVSSMGDFNAVAATGANVEYRSEFFFAEVIDGRVRMTYEIRGGVNQVIQLSAERPGAPILVQIRPVFPDGEFTDPVAVGIGDQEVKLSSTDSSGFLSFETAADASSLYYRVEDGVGSDHFISEWPWPSVPEPSSDPALGPASPSAILFAAADAAALITGPRHAAFVAQAREADGREAIERQLVERLEAYLRVVGAEGLSPGQRKGLMEMGLQLERLKAYPERGPEAEGLLELVDQHRAAARRRGLRGK